VAEKEKGFPNPKPRRRFDRPVSRRREHKRRRWRRSWGRRRASSRARICSPRPSATARSGISSTTAAPAEVSPPRRSARPTSSPPHARLPVCEGSI
jgi:hypothetical protein